MRNINKVILLGNLTRDPELKKTVSAQSITTFGVATNREWMTKDGRREQSAEFHELVCFGGFAEFAATHLKKGKLVYIEGHLKTRSWDDANGLKKFKTEIVVEDLIMLDKRPREEQTKGSLHEPAEEMQPTVTVEDPMTI
jgi:single-strand DNA-binding protein